VKQNQDKNKKKQKPKNPGKQIKGLDIDKAEYQEIVLSNSNFPDKFRNYD